MRILTEGQDHNHRSAREEEEKVTWKETSWGWQELKEKGGGKKQ